MTLDEGVAQAVSVKDPNKESWSQQRPREPGSGALHLRVYESAHRRTWLWLWEGEHEIVEGGHG